jgi:CHAD domain-containing protein
MEASELLDTKAGVVQSPEPILGDLLGSKAALSLCPAASVPCPPRQLADLTWHSPKPVPVRLPLSARSAPVAVGPTLAKTLQSRWESYCEQLGHCQRKFSEEAVHELRVATRRLLAELHLLSFIVPSAELQNVRRILKRRLSALGDLRDVQVQRVFVEGKTASFPELLLLGAWLRRRERRLAKSAAREVERCKTRKLEKWIAALNADLTAKADSARVQSRLATAVLRAATEAFAETVERRKAIDLADLRTIHQTRIAFKRFRYMIEILSPDLTGLSKGQLRALAYYQRKMGRIQDLEVMRARLEGYIGQNTQRQRLLRRFIHYVHQRRARTLRVFLKSADRLYGFWPPPRLGAWEQALPTRTAA